MAPVLLAYCRAGFEAECAQEVAARAAGAAIRGHIRAKPESALVTFHPDAPGEASGWFEGQAPSDWVFARQLLASAGLLKDLPPGDRAGPIAELAAALERPFRQLVLESPDTNEGRGLSSLLRPLRTPLLRALADAGVGIGVSTATDDLHVCFVGTGACHVATGRSGLVAPWPMGIPRVRARGRPPSRSAHKLAEAFLVFLGGSPHVEPGSLAVDLGAAPGGWASQLVAAGMHVIAVDNGPLAPSLLETGQVTHRREDGFRYRPAGPVEWMVCDMVESPSRVARLAAEWVRDGACRQTIFNLKLPMKRRWDEVQRARQIVAEVLEGRRHALKVKQLYHDREEVTAWLALQ